MKLFIGGLNEQYGMELGRQFRSQLEEAFNELSQQQQEDEIKLAINERNNILYLYTHENDVIWGLEILQLEETMLITKFCNTAK